MNPPQIEMSVAPIPPQIVAIERPRESLMTYYVLKAIAANVAFPFVFPYLYFRYHTMRYRFDTDGPVRTVQFGDYDGNGLVDLLFVQARVQGGAASEDNAIMTQPMAHPTFRFGYKFNQSANIAIFDSRWRIVYDFVHAAG